MRLRHLLSVSALLSVVVLVAPLHGADPPHVVMISIDGLMPSVYTEPGPSTVPTLRALAARGVSARGVVGVLPTVTYPSHTTIITGVPPSIHGIVNNRILDPEDRSNGAWYWYANAIKAPTLPGQLRALGLRTAGVSWPVTIGMEMDYVVPEYGRVSQHPEALSLIEGLSWPRRVFSSYAAATGRELPWPPTDRDRAELAAYFIRAHKPHLTLLHLVETDGVQHRDGPGSPEALQAIERADANVAIVLKAIEESGVAARTTVVIVSDHGFVTVKTQLQANHLFKNEGLLTVNDRGRVTEWRAFVQPAGGSAFVYLKAPDDEALKTRVGALLQTLAADPANGIDRVWTASDLAKIGADPAASYAVTMKEGFYTGLGHDRLLAATTGKGGHGFAPTLPAVHASLIVSGPVVTNPGNLGLVRMTQIAPTVAEWFGVRLSPKADQPIGAHSR